MTTSSPPKPASEVFMRALERAIRARTARLKAERQEIIAVRELRELLGNKGGGS